MLVAWSFTSAYSIVAFNGVINLISKSYQCPMASVASAVVLIARHARGRAVSRVEAEEH
jgi:hypothetical protein